jgi:hypothetical protein
LVHEHDLDGLPTELEAAWLGEGAEQRSLRELATLFNERLVRAVMVDAGMNPLEGEAANVYDLLDGGDATGGAKVRAERRLDREGVDVEALQSSFVSHQAIHTYLTTVREVEHSDASTGTTDRADAVERLLGRTRSVSEGVVEGLAADGELDIGEFDVSASVHVTCRDCNSRYEFGELRRRGGCRCGE